MFSAFKRLATKSDVSANNVDALNRAPGHQSMSTSLQRKFAKGVQYNMKIVIKGDRNVGKTCLFQRLQGKKFLEEYIPTDEIQVASIHWNYKAADDIVKVEVWDVVDRGKKKKRFDGLKLETNQLEIAEETALDAEFLDVYKGTNGVIMVMDLTKTWTFDYIQREIPKVPIHIPIIILANHCDMSHHRAVTADHVLYYIESISSARVSQVRYAESSMRNGFGLKLLHKFFNLPFLQLQRETLLRQLSRNEEETNATIQELDMYFDSDEANYNKFLDSLIRKRREIADLNANIPSQQQATMHISSSSHQLGKESPQPHQQDIVKRSQSGPIVIGAGKPIPFSTTNGSVIRKTPASVLQSSKNPPGTIGSKFMHKEEKLPDIKRLEINPITSVDEFCPDGGQLDRSFLDDVQTSSQGNVVNDAVESDSDEDTGNPLVSELQDDFEPDEPVFSKANAYIRPSESKVSNCSLKRPEYQNEIEIDKTLPEDYEMKQTNDEFDSTINSEISEITSEAFDTWMANDTKWRRSPEGGEDVSALSQTLDHSGSTAYDDSNSFTSSNVHMELLSSKHHSNASANMSANSDSEGASSHNSVRKDKKKENEKADKKHKSKKSKDKDKTEKDLKKRSREENSSSHSRKDELEEFLNGSNSPIADSAYEAI